MLEKTPKAITIQFIIFVVLLVMPFITLMFKKNFIDIETLAYPFMLVFVLLLTIPHFYLRSKQPLKFSTKVSLILTLMIIGVVIIHYIIGSKLRVFGAGEDRFGDMLSSIGMAVLAIILFVVNSIALSARSGVSRFKQ